jgi:hypothetical protein
MAERFPRAYVNTVKKDPMMEYVPFDNTEIGARKSGVPKSLSSTDKCLSLDHVGGTASGSR